MESVRNLWIKFTQSKNFFHLPLEEKMKLLRNDTPVLDELLNPANQIHGDHKEGFYIGIELPEDDPQAQRPFYGTNLWPDSDILPGWRQTMERYQQALEVVKKTARLIALALDLDANFFELPEMLSNPIAILRLLHYEGQASDPAKGIYGAGAHSDYGLITLLATDSVSGLQICKDKDAKPQVWEYVEPLKGAFVVNLGDMLERWSNGVFRFHTLCCLVMIVWLSVYLPANQNKTHPSFLRSDVKRTFFKNIRIRMLILVHTTDPEFECWTWSLM